MGFLNVVSGMLKFLEVNRYHIHMIGGISMRPDTASEILPLFNLFHERFEKVYRYRKEYGGIILGSYFRKRL